MGGLALLVAVIAVIVVYGQILARFLLICIFCALCPFLLAVFYEHVGCAIPPSRCPQWDCRRVEVDYGTDCSCVC